MKLIVFLAVIGYVAAQTTVLPIRRVVVNDGRYSGYDDGRYRPDDSGKYTGDNGKYVHDDKGYVHQEPLYVEKPQPQVIFVSTPAPTTEAPVTKAPEPIKPVTVVQYVKPTPQVEYVGYPYNRQYNYDTEGGWKILRLLKEINQDGYNYAYETENKIVGQESGRVHDYKTGVDNEYHYGGIRANGFYEYVGDDGVVYRVDYLADENGFQPVGVHIPREWVETLSSTF